MEKQQDEEIEIDLLELFGVVRARWFSILMTGIILAAVAVGAEAFTGRCLEDGAK